MTIVFTYGFEGTYTGNASYEYDHPEAGATHKCILFLKQSGQESLFDQALLECSKYGFSNVAFGTSGRILDNCGSIYP